MGRFAKRRAAMDWHPVAVTAREILLAADQAIAYRQEVEGIIGGFQHEFCGACGGDLSDHTIAPDALGHAHAWCLNEEA